MIATPEPLQTQAIPAALIYEVLNGRPLYYRGYREVMAQHLNPEYVMGSSSLQSILVTIINLYLGQVLNRKKYIPATNEAGLHLGANENLSCDIAIFDKSAFSLTTKYFDTTPKVVIEVDIKIDLALFDGADHDYVTEKTQRLFDFGVERVIWVLSKSRRVFVAVPNQDWILTDWANDVPVMEGITLNVKQLLDEEAIPY